MLGKAFTDAVHIIHKHGDELITTWNLRINILVKEIIRNSKGKTWKHLETVILFHICPDIMEIGKLCRQIVHHNAKRGNLFEITLIHLMKKFQGILFFKDNTGLHVFGEEKSVPGRQYKVRKQKEIGR